MPTASLLIERLREENDELRRRLEEAEATIEAIRAGQVDAFVVAPEPGSEHVLTLETAERPYRAVVEHIQQGAVALATDGTILYANRPFAELLQTSPEGVVGCAIGSFVSPGCRAALEKILERGRHGAVGECQLVCADGSPLPASVAAHPLPDGSAGLCLIVSDLRLQKRHEEVAAAEALARSILEQAAEAIVVCDPTGTVVRASQAARRLCCCDPTGRRFAEAFPLRDVAGSPVLLDGALRGEVIRGQEAVLPLPDGGGCDLLLSAGPLRDEADRVCGSVVTLTDIGERKRLEADLRESEARSRHLFDSNLVPTAYWSADGRITGANGAFLDLLGYGRAELNAGAIRWDRITPPEHLPRVRRSIEELLAGASKSTPFEKEFRRKDGGRVPVLIGSALLPGRTDEGVSYAIDLTERKRIEQALREGEEKLRVALDTGRLGSWEYDLATGELGMTARAKAFFGFLVDAACSWDDCLGRIHPGDRPNVRQRLESAVAERRDYEAEYRVVWPDGSVRWLIARGRPLYAADGRPLRMIGVCLDVTERKRTEETLKEADKRKDEFLAVLAHELRNPLAPIRNALELLRRAGGDDGAAVDRTRAVMERQVRQMVRLIDDLLDVSRIARGGIELRTGRVELAAVVQSAVETSRPQLEAAGHSLSVELPRESVWLEADPARLAQVLSNLLNNAARYTDRGGRIGLTARREGDEAVVRVRDTGVGIPGSLLPRIFEMFTQLDRDSERSRSGLGIGLTLVKRLAEMHGGSVEAHSDGPGKGSEFVVRLPVAAAPETAPTPAAPPAPEAGPVRRRVLVVEDHPDSAESLAELLRALGHAVRVAPDGPAALAAAEAELPEVVLCDVGLPGMDGYEVARRLRRMPGGGRVRLAALSGYGQEEDLRSAEAAGFDRHFTKPVDPDEVQNYLAEPADGEG